MSNNFKSYRKLVLIYFIKQILIFFAVVIPASFNIIPEPYLHLSGLWNIIVDPVLIVSLLSISALLILKMLPFSMSYYVLIDNPDSTIKKRCPKVKNYLKIIQRKLLNYTFLIFWIHWLLYLEFYFGICFRIFIYALFNFSSTRICY